MEIYFETKNAYGFWHKHIIPCTLKEAEQYSRRWEVLKKRHQGWDKNFRNFKINMKVKNKDKD